MGVKPVQNISRDHTPSSPSRLETLGDLHLSTSLSLFTIPTENPRRFILAHEPPPPPPPISIVFNHYDGEEGTEPWLGPAEFREFAVEVLAGVVVDNATAAVARRVPIGVGGIVGVGMGVRAGKDLVGALVGIYSVGVAAAVYLSFVNWIGEYGDVAISSCLTLHGLFSI